MTAAAKATSPTDSSAKASAPNLQRGLCVLEFLATVQPTATVAELAERLGYPIASLYRIASVLDDMGYVSRDPVTRRYGLTNKMLRFGQPQNIQRGLVETAIPSLRGLWRLTGETSQVCCLVDTETVVLEQFVSVHPFKYSTDIGARVSCYSCAPGKAIIAWMSDDTREELISRLTFKRFTKTTITSARRFRKEVDAIRQRGYSIDDGEGLEGIHCIAAPILDANEVPVGAFTIAAPATRLPKSLFAEKGKLVVEAAQAASHAYA
ncbi:MAG: IclR family transcriptional regulator [Rubripirellula sp.]